MITYTLALLVISSCVKEESQLTDPLMKVETLSNGIVRITYAVLPFRKLTLDTLAVIDPWSEDTGYMFSSIGSVLGGDESVYIVDRRNKEIAQLGLTGTFIRAFGRPGGGPGEFDLPGMIVWRDEQLWISDNGHRRLSVFSKSGDLMHDNSWPQTIGRRLGRFEVSPDGRIYSIFQATGNNYLCRYAEGNAYADTILTMDAAPAQAVILESRPGLKQSIYTTPIFAAYLWWTLSDKSLVTVGSLDYRIEFRNLDGELESFLEIPTTPLLVSQDMKRKWIEEEFDSSPYAFAFTRAGDQPTSESLNQLPFAERRQSIIGLIVDPLARIWVLSPTEDPSIDNVHIFGWDAKYLGNLERNELPVSFLTDGSPIFSVQGEDNLERFIVVKVIGP